MKLVDILARELKVWPEGRESCVQSRVDTQIYFDDGGPDDLYVDGRAVDGGMCGARVTREQWQAAVDALKVVEWNGDGLPPIGMHVVVHDDGSLVYGRGESGEVIAHVDGCAVIRMSYGLGCFLPRCLRTPEQIAAEEREKAACELYCTINWHGGVPEWKNQTESRKQDYFKAIDAGYRKQEP